MQSAKISKANFVSFNCAPCATCGVIYNPLRRCNKMTFSKFRHMENHFKQGVCYWWHTSEAFTTDWVEKCCVPMQVAGAYFLDFTWFPAYVRIGNPGQLVLRTMCYSYLLLNLVLYKTDVSIPTSSLDNTQECQEENNAMPEQTDD